MLDIIYGIIVLGRYVCVWASIAELRCVVGGFSCCFDFGAFCFLLFCALQRKIVHTFYLSHRWMRLRHDWCAIAYILLFSSTLSLASCSTCLQAMMYSLCWYGRYLLLLLLLRTVKLFYTKTVERLVFRPISKIRARQTAAAVLDSFWQCKFMRTFSNEINRYIFVCSEKTIKWWSLLHTKYDTYTHTHITSHTYVCL